MTGKTSTLESGPVTATQYFLAHEIRAILAGDQVMRGRNIEGNTSKTFERGEK